MKNSSNPLPDAKYNEKLNISDKIKVLVIVSATSYNFHFFGNFYISEGILLLIFIYNFLKSQAFMYSSTLKTFNKLQIGRAHV